MLWVISHFDISLFFFFMCRRPTALQDRMRDSDDDDLHDRDYDVAALANNLSQAFGYKIYGNEDNEEVCSCWPPPMCMHVYIFCLYMCIFSFLFFQFPWFAFWVGHFNLNAGLMLWLAWLQERSGLDRDDEVVVWFIFVDFCNVWLNLGILRTSSLSLQNVSIRKLGDYLLLILALPVL